MNKSKHFKLQAYILLSYLATHGHLEAEVSRAAAGTTICWPTVL